MKIAQVASTFPPYEGGTGNVCYNQSKYLASFGHEVTVFLPLNSEGTFQEQDQKFKVKYLKPLFSYGNGSFLPKLTKELKNFDIIHLHYPFFGGDIFVRMAAKKFNIPYFITYHLDIYGNTFLKSMIFKIYNALFQRKIITDAAKISVSSKEFFAQSQIYNLVKRNQLEIIPCGVDTLETTGQTQEIFNQYHINKDTPIIVFIGVLDSAHYFKRLDILIKALSKIKHEFHLLIIGDGNLRSDFVGMVKEHSLEKFVTFTGKLSNKKVLNLLSQANFLVLPSDNESFGIVLIEAMSCGKPVVASNIPGIRAVVTDQVDGLLFQKGDVEDLALKIEYLIANPEIAKKLGDNGERIVKEKYEWKKIVKTIEKLYFDRVNYVG